MCNMTNWSYNGFKVLLGQNLGGVQLAEVGARTPSEHRLGTFEQGTEPPNADIGPTYHPYVAETLPGPFL